MFLRSMEMTSVLRSVAMWARNSELWALRRSMDQNPSGTEATLLQHDGLGWRLYSSRNLR